MTNYTKKETDKDGNVLYYNDKGQYHRLDGPAAEYADGGKSWWVDGRLHRLDGPAIERVDGSKSWFVDDKSLTEEQFNKHPLVVEARMVRLIGEVLDGGK